MASISTLAENEITIFGRIIASSNEPISRDTAKYLLSLDFPLEEKKRMHVLSKRAQAGSLTTQEKIEIESYERVGHLLSIWKSKARKSLRQNRRESR